MNYKLLMFLIAANVGWWNYTMNMTVFSAKNVLELPPTRLAKLASLTALPWSMKPIWGFLVDSFSLFGYKFKSHSVIMGVLNSPAASAFIFNPKPSMEVFTSVLFLLTVTATYLDSMAQGLTAVITKLDEKLIALKDPENGNKSSLKFFWALQLLQVANPHHNGVHRRVCGGRDGQNPLNGLRNHPGLLPSTVLNFDVFRVQRGKIELILLQRLRRVHHRSQNVPKIGPGQRRDQAVLPSDPLLLPAPDEPGLHLHVADDGRLDLQSVQRLESGRNDRCEPHLPFRGQKKSLGSSPAPF